MMKILSTLLRGRTVDISRDPRQYLWTGFLLLVIWTALWFVAIWVFLSLRRQRLDNKFRGYVYITPKLSSNIGQIKMDRVRIDLDDSEVKKEEEKFFPRLPLAARGQDRQIPIQTILKRYIGLYETRYEKRMKPDSEEYEEILKKLIRNRTFCLSLGVLCYPRRQMEIKEVSEEVKVEAVSMHELTLTVPLPKRMHLRVGDTAIENLSIEIEHELT